MSHVHPNNANIQVYGHRAVGGVNPPTVTLKVSRYSSVGCYPMFYATADGRVLSAKAVEENLDECCDPDDDGWFVVASDANWENPELFCDHTGERIESAYAEPDDDEISEKE